MKRFIFALLLLVTVGVAMMLGYAAGRGGLALPVGIRAQLAAAMPWLPLPASTPQTARSGAASEAYEFQLVQPELKQGDGAVVTVRLVHKPSGKPVPDALIFARRVDMAPEGMATMTAPLEPMPGDEPGTYRFKTNLMMEGGWQLSLAAKVQGEPGTVSNRLALKAVP